MTERYVKASELEKLADILEHESSDSFSDAYNDGHCNAMDIACRLIRSLIAAAQPREVDEAAEREAQKLIYGFMLDCNAIGLHGAAENLHRGIKEAAKRHERGEG